LLQKGKKNYFLIRANWIRFCKTFNRYEGKKSLWIYFLQYLIAYGEWKVLYHHWECFCTIPIAYGEWEGLIFDPFSIMEWLARRA
jgi:hypothetical protein